MKVIGYVVAVVGIILMALGFQVVRPTWELLNLLPLNYLGGIGVAAVGAGVIIVLMGKEKGVRGKGSGHDEVPIYEGVGKKRRIVGYRKG